MSEKKQYRGKGKGVVSYDNLSRGRKQQIDYNRRKALEEAKAMPESRMADTVVDLAQGVGRLIGGRDTGSARASYKANREAAIRKAQDKADYKDVRDAKKSGEGLYFEDSSTDRDDMMSDIKKNKYRNMRRSTADTDKEFKKGGAVKKRRDGIAQRGKTKGRMC